MPSDRRLVTGGAALVALTAVVSALAYPEMPAEMATHWNASGDVDNTMPRALGLVLFPVLNAGLLALFVALPRVDPRTDYESFRPAYDALALTTLGLFAYLNVVVVLANLGYAFELLQALAPAIGAVYVVAGTVTRHAEQNWFVGVRTPWTLEDEAVWEQTNRVVGRLFQVGGVVAALGVFVPAYALAFILAPALVVAVVSFGYSYYLYRQGD
jgi:uncharacterized membrane protein